MSDTVTNQKPTSPYDSLPEWEQKNLVKMQQQLNEKIFDLINLFCVQFQQSVLEVRKTLDRDTPDGFGLQCIQLEFSNCHKFGFDEDGYLEQHYYVSTRDEFEQKKFKRSFAHNGQNPTDGVLAIDSHVLELVTFALDCHDNRNENKFWELILNNTSDESDNCGIAFRMDYPFLHDLFQRRQHPTDSTKLSMEDFFETIEFHLANYFNHYNFLHRFIEHAAPYSSSGTSATLLDLEDFDSATLRFNIGKFLDTTKVCPSAVSITWNRKSIQQCQNGIVSLFVHETDPDFFQSCDIACSPKRLLTFMQNFLFNATIQSDKTLYNFKWTVENTSDQRYAIVMELFVPGTDFANGNRKRKITKS